MRVVSGRAKKAKLKAVPGKKTRPILDRVKAPLFDILRPVISGMQVLDLFAGTGAVGIEALSQGAEFCVFVEASTQAARVVRENLESTELSGLAEVRQSDAFTYLRNTKRSFNLIYLDPPQFNGLWIEALHFIAERPNLLAPGGMVVVKIHPKEYEALSLNVLHETQKRKYGNSMLLFYTTDT